MSPPREIPVLSANTQSVLETAEVNPLLREVYEHNKNAVVQITGKAPNGQEFRASGVLVKDSGEVSIVTNAHVASNIRSLSFHSPAGETFSARLTKISAADDLALLKPEGVKINPALAVDLGGTAQLNTTQSLYAMGHPRGYSRPTISEGNLLRIGSLDQVASPMAALTREAVTHLYGDNPAYKAQGERFASIPRLDVKVAIDHGSSGGGLFDDKGKLVGILQAMPDENNPNEAVAVSVERVRNLISGPTDKFGFSYQNESLATQNPGMFTAKVAGVAALGLGPGARRVAVPLAGLYYGGRAIEDISYLSKETLFDSREHYAGKLVADGGAFAAGMLSLNPRFRVAGMAVVGARLAVDAVSDVFQTRPVLDKVVAQDADTPEPLFWKLSHH